MTGQGSKVEDLPQMTDFTNARRAMVETQLRTFSITDRRVLAAFGEVPRELFVPTARRELAYTDDAHRLDAGSGVRSLPAPAVFARLLQLAEVRSTDHVLDLGAGNGYSTAVISRLCATVVGVEPDAVLADAARKTLGGLDYDNASVVNGAIDTAGRAGGPYDLIVLSGSVDARPDVHFAHLKDGGRLVAMIRKGPTSVAHLFVKSGRDIAARSDFDGGLPPLPVPARAPEFVF